MKRQVAAAHRENAPVIEETNLLLSQKRELETKRQLLNAFNDHFIVTEDDLSVLMTASDGVDERFFTVLKRLKAVHGDCQVLLGSENQQLGVELMDECSRHLNMGYQKLFRWIQKELKNLNLENPQINAIIRRALRALSERPTLFQSCLDFFAEARERVLTDGFYAALTGASNSGEQDRMKPIEFHAHDPLRYVGDMLAWTHSATVSEREALESLFISEAEEFKKGFEAGRGSEPWSFGEGEAFDGQKALKDLVNRDVAGVAKALRQRIEQVLQNHEDPVLLYKLSNLINFYRTTFSKLVGSESSLLDTLEALQESALRHFCSITNESITSITSDLAGPPLDLSIPDFLDDSLTQMIELLKSFDASLVPPESRAEVFKPIVQAAFDPILAACEKMAKEADEPYDRIFQTNCLLAAQSTFSKHAFVADRLANLTVQLDACTANLIDYQLAFFVHTSALHPLLAALAPLDEPDTDSESQSKSRSETKLAKLATSLPAALKPRALSDASQALDEFLPSALMDAMENLKRLTSKAVAQDITAEAAERFCQDFEFVEGKLLAIDRVRTQLRKKNGHSGIEDDDDDEDADEDADDHENDEDEDEELEEGQPKRERNERDGRVPLKSLFPRTSGEIRVLLS